MLMPFSFALLHLFAYSRSLLLAILCFALSPSLFTYKCRFDEYREHLIQHLLRVKLMHVDKAVRRIAARALGRMCAVAPRYMAEQLPLLVRFFVVLSLVTIVNF